MEYNDVMRITHVNKARRGFPSNTDPRSSEGSLFPNFIPKFKLEISPKTKIFTIGSCFARNVEEALEPLGVNLPTMEFKVDYAEWPNRPNGLLNEYNPGSIFQRITYARENREFPKEIIVPFRDGYIDLLLSMGCEPVVFERAVERQRQIEQIYTHLFTADLVVITLGFIQCWFDRETKLFINRAPPLNKSMPGRFEFRKLDVDDSMPLLEPALRALNDARIKTVLTVSPVPLQTTFENEDCVVSNEFSKAVLRVCAERLSRKFEWVDYFPSYEIVRSGGLSNYRPDQVHPKHPLVARITNMMVSAYSA